MKRLDDIPVWLFALLTVAAFDATALGGLVCTRRWGDWLGLYAVVDNNTVSWIFCAILVMYAIALGLIAVATWGNASSASAARLQRRHTSDSQKCSFLEAHYERSDPLT
jgi:hypothetical protein